MKYALRAASSVLMLAFMLALLGVLAVLMIAAVTTLLVVALRAGGRWATGAVVLVIALFAGLGGWLFLRYRRGSRQVKGVSVAPDVQPLFWVEIYRVAECLGTRAPDEVLLFPDTSAEATGHRRWLGVRPGVRRLHLGLPLLAGLTERELRAVIARAFCLTWGQAPLARISRLGQEIVGRVADVVGEGWFVGRYVGRYRRTYDALSVPLIGRHELAVDGLCADFAGNQATAAAFSEVAVLREGWASFVEGCAEPAAALGRRPDAFFAGFTSFLQEPGRREQLIEAAGASASEKPWAGERPLSIADRLAAIAALPEDDIHDRSGSALGLMRYPELVTHDVEEAMFGGAEFLPDTWQDILPQADRTVACEDARDLVRLAHEGGLGRSLSVTALLELLSFELVDEVVRPMAPEGSPPGVGRLLAGRLVTGFLATAAIESGTASYRFSWAVPRQLVNEKGEVEDLRLLVDTVLADGGQVSELERWLTAHRVSHELELGMDPPETVPSPLPGAQPDTGLDGAVDEPAGAVVDDPAGAVVDDYSDGPGDSPVDRPREEPAGSPFPALLPEAGSGST